MSGSANDQRAIIRKLTRKYIWANRKRNLIIVAAIVITSYMIATVATIGMSMYATMEAEVMRWRGSMSQGSFYRPNSAQLEGLAEHVRQHNLLPENRPSGPRTYIVTHFGLRLHAGTLESTPEMGAVIVNMYHFDDSLYNDFYAPVWTNIIGNPPQEINEIMASRALLSRMGIENPEIGMIISFSYVPINASDGRVGSFVLSGIYSSVDYLRPERVLLVSRSLAVRYGATPLYNGRVDMQYATIGNDANMTRMIFHELDAISPAAPYRAERDFLRQLGDITPEQEARAREVMRRIRELPQHFTPAHSLVLIEDPEVFVPIVVLLAVILLTTAYLLIYNVLYISVAKDVQFYGMLKTLGTTSKQIKRIVRGQVLLPAVVGIPTGLILGMVTAFIIVPISIRMTDLTTSPVMSFSPSIYLITILFTLAALYIGATAPARKAARITPIEAMRHAGEIRVTNRARFHTKGKLYRIAIRNIFRDWKRSTVVLFSLFLGGTAFIAISTLITSFHVDRFIDSITVADFVLHNDRRFAPLPNEIAFDNKLVAQIYEIDGVEAVHTVKRASTRMPYQPIITPRMERLEVQYFETYGYPVSLWAQGITIRDLIMGDGLYGAIFGIDPGMLAELDHDRPIDIEAFGRGEFAVVVTDDPVTYRYVTDVEVIIGEAEEIVLHIPLGGMVSRFPDAPISPMAPTMLVANTLLSRYLDYTAIQYVNIHTDRDYDPYIMERIQDLIWDSRNIRMESRFGLRNQISDFQSVLGIIGGVIIFILSISGVLNFVNSISVGVLVRKNELATMESIGMSPKQLRRMLIDEGLGYAVISLILIAALGYMAAYTLFTMVIALPGTEMMYFTYPVFPALMALVTVIGVSIFVPMLAYRSINQHSIVDRLKDGDS